MCIEDADEDDGGDLEVDTGMGGAGATADEGDRAASSAELGEVEDSSREESLFKVDNTVEVKCPGWNRWYRAKVMSEPVNDKADWTNDTKRKVEVSIEPSGHTESIDSAEQRLVLLSECRQFSYAQLSTHKPVEVGPVENDEDSKRRAFQHAEAFQWIPAMVFDDEERGVLGEVVSCATVRHDRQAELVNEILVDSKALEIGHRVVELPGARRQHFRSKITDPDQLACAKAHYEAALAAKRGPESLGKLSFIYNLLCQLRSEDSVPRSLGSMLPGPRFVLLPKVDASFVIEWGLVVKGMSSTGTAIRRKPRTNTKGQVLNPGNSELLTHLDGSPTPKGNQFEIAIQVPIPTAELPEEQDEEQEEQEEEKASSKGGKNKQSSGGGGGVTTTTTTTYKLPKISVVTLPGDDLEWRDVIVQTKIAIAQKKAVLLVIAKQAAEASDHFHHIVGRDQSKPSIPVMLASGAAGNALIQEHGRQARANATQKYSFGCRLCMVHHFAGCTVNDEVGVCSCVGRRVVTPLQEHSIMVDDYPDGGGGVLGGGGSNSNRPVRYEEVEITALEPHEYNPDGMSNAVIKRVRNCAIEGDHSSMQARWQQALLPPVEVDKCRLISTGDKVVTKWKSGKYIHDAEVADITETGRVMIHYPPPAHNEPQCRCTSRCVRHVRRLPSEILNNNLTEARQKKALEDGRVLVDRRDLEARLAAEKQERLPAPIGEGRDLMQGGTDQVAGEEERKDGDEEYSEPHWKIWSVNGKEVKGGGQADENETKGDASRPHQALTGAAAVIEEFNAARRRSNAEEGVIREEERQQRERDK